MGVHSFQANHLYSYLLAFIIITNAAVDHAAETSPYHIVQMETIWTYPLF